MASIAKLVVSLGANISHFETDMKRATRNQEKRMRQMERQAKRLNDKWNQNFRMMGLAVAGGLALATKAAAEFENAMAEVSTLLDDTTGLDKTADAVKGLSVEFGQAPVDQAKALYQIISAGASSSAEQMENLTAANRLAVGGVTDVMTAADGLTTVLNAYSGTGLDVNRISDIMFNTMKNGKTTVGELAGSIGNVATIAAATGVSFEEVGAAVGTLTKAGINTSQSMDALRGVLSAVLKQSDQSVRMANELGVEFNATALEAKGLHKFLADIAETGATSEQLAKLFGRVEGLNAVMALGSDNGREFTDQLNSMASAAGATETAVDKMSATTQFKAAQAQAAFNTLGVEIGQKFLSSVSTMATGFVNNFEKIAAIIESVVILLTVRLGVAGVAALAAATSGTTALATAMAFLGGPIGAVALGLAGIGIAISNYLDHIKEIEEIANRLKSAGDIVTQAWVDQASHEQLISQQNELRESWVQAEKRLMELRGAIGDSTIGLGDLREEQSLLLALQAQALTGLGRISSKLKDQADEAEEAAKQTRSLAAAMKSAEPRIAASQKKLNGVVSELDALIDKEKEKLRLDYAIAQSQRRTNQLWQETGEILDELIEEQGEYERQLQQILDTLNPVEAAGRAFGEQLAILTRHYEEGGMEAEEYNAAVAKLTGTFDNQVNSINGVKEEVNLLNTAIDEGVRILERTFTNLWENILDGSGKAFEGIKDGFKSLMANLIHQATTQKIVLNIQQGLQGQGTGPGGGINWQQLGTDMAAFAGVIAGTELGGGSTASAFGASAGALVGGALGSAYGSIGTAIGSIAGGIIGGMIGKAFNKIFGKNKTPRIEIGTGFDIKPGDSQTFLSAFGQTSVGNTRGGMDDHVQEFGAALQQFDDSLASFLSDDYIGAITDSLDGWSASLRGESITIEELLNRRFAWIMHNFSETIQGFVAEGEDLARKADRLQVATSAETLIGDNADLFGDRTLGEFLQIVEAFKNGNQTIVEAYNEVLALLNIIGPVYESLEAFRDSSLGDDFAAMLAGVDVSLQEALAGLVSGLDDAIRNFDGSPEQLQRIGAIVASIREGEIKLLAEIDSIQKGISANLAKLKDDLLGVTQNKTGEQLFNEAAGLIGSLTSATTTQEVAEIARQFEALIRQMSPEDQARNTSELVRMVEDFDKLQTEVLEGMKQSVLDAATDTRAMVDDFIERIGTPLDLLVGSNQEVAEALGEGGAFEQMTIDNETHQGNVEGILEAGVDDIAAEVNNIGPVVANALQSALQGTDINVQVVVNGGLVTQ